MEKVTNQHGDVVLVKINLIPKDAKKLQWHKGFILEKGEGVHTHTIEGECEIYEKEGTMYLKVNSPVRLDHEEHGTQTLEPGIYKKEIERVFSYEDMEARKVQD